MNDETLAHRVKNHAETAGDSLGYTFLTDGATDSHSVTWRQHVSLSNPADLVNEVYNVSLAGSTLVWAISSAFFFINIAVFYRRDRRAFEQQRIFPKPVLFISMLLGPLACLFAIVDTLFFSWIPQIDNGHWWYIVGGLTLVCLVIATIGSMVASSEASWESLESSTR